MPPQNFIFSKNIFENPTIAAIEALDSIENDVGLKEVGAKMIWK